MTVTERYQRPGWFTEHAFNRVVAGLTRLGVSVAGSRVLEVRGRKTGEPRQTPVNLLTIDGTRYLVAPRGHTHWVRNLRARGEGRLLLGRRAEAFTAIELTDDDKPALLRAYLKRWKWVGSRRFFRRGGTRFDRRRAPSNRPRPPDLPDRAAGRLTFEWSRAGWTGRGWKRKCRLDELQARRPGAPAAHRASPSPASGRRLGA